MKSNYEGELWTCDACGRQTVHAKDAPPPGYSGTVADGLGNFWEWFACRKVCVARAIWTAYARPDNPVGDD